MELTKRDKAFFDNSILYLNAELNSAFKYYEIDELFEKIVLSDTVLFL